LHRFVYLCKLNSQKTYPAAPLSLSIWRNIIETLPAQLILEDGSVYQGLSFGYPRSVAGEVVFNTGMTGYPEALSDPSYFGQILTFTFPLIGNYGMPPAQRAEDWHTHYESSKGMVSGVVIDNYSQAYSHYGAGSGLMQWLYNQKIPAIAGIDTRSLTRKIREKGAMLGKILINDEPVEFYDPNRLNLVEQVSAPEVTPMGRGKKRLLFVDCGAKQSIVNELLSRDVRLLRVPWDYPFQDDRYDGIVLSSGPGDPKLCQATIRQVRWAMEKDKPLFGICLGHQIMALAAGADTFKMKYGHRGQNQPVIDTSSGKAYITSQNHGFAVDDNSLPAQWRPLFSNINDHTCEGLIHASGKCFSVQFHPEASPGPEDTRFLFDRFLAQI